MPNWTTNNLMITGPAQALEKFKRKCAVGNAAKQHVFTFGLFLPAPKALAGIRTGGCQVGHHYVRQWREVNGYNEMIPEKEEQRLRALYGCANSYDWNCKNYGTKWDVEGDLVDNGGSLVCCFDTAWNAPIAAIENISKLYPSLTFVMSWVDEGQDDDESSENFVSIKNGSEI